MKLRSKNLLAIAGIAGIMFGVVSFVPSLLQENYAIVTVSALLMVGGLILLAIAFGD